jgi:hypothetical protein
MLQNVSIAPALNIKHLLNEKFLHAIRGFLHAETKKFVHSRIQQ